MSTSTKSTTARRRKGEGSVSRFHNHPSCPPAVGGVRPDHTCKAGWRGRVVVSKGLAKKTLTVYKPTQAEAAKALRNLIAENEKGTVVLATMTVEDWLDQWFLQAAPALKVNTLKGYRSKIDTVLKPHLGHLKLTKLEPAHVRGMYASLRAEGKAEATIRQAHAILHRALKVAMREELVGRNVTEMVDAPSSVSSAPRTPLSVGDAWKVLRMAGDNPRPWLALMCGLRQGEALALRWFDLHLDHVDDNGEPAPYLVVREALSREPGVGLVFDKPKSRTSTNRVVPLPGPVAARLAVQWAKAVARGDSRDDLVFPNAKGDGPLDPRRDYMQWCALLGAAGVDHHPLHAARNTTAHLLADAKVSEGVAMEILGHSQVSMTRHYQWGNIGLRTEGMRALEAHMASKEPADSVSLESVQ